MATNTNIPLLSQTVTGSSTNTITFNSIPQTYTDLDIVMSARTGTGGATEFRLATNLSGSIYSSVFVDGSGTSSASFRDVPTTSCRPGFIAGSTQSFSINEFTIMNYSNAVTDKTIIGRYGSVENEVLSFATLIANTGAVNSLTFTCSAGFAVGTTISIYGIAAQPVVTSAKATGGTITFGADGYTYHAFTSSGTFTPSANLSCDVLVVAGGGGGGADNYPGGGTWQRYGNGGGAGGLRTATLSLTNGTAYTATVGSFGGGVFNNTGAQGSNSSLAGSGLTTLAATGGGGGGTHLSAPPYYSGSTNGGSGGGGDNGSGVLQPGNAGGYSPAEGYSGGWQYGGGGNNAIMGGGGGGGAGGAGLNAPEYPSGSLAIGGGGAGGIGATSPIITAMGNATRLGESVAGNVYFAGGGGGTAGNTVATGVGGYGGGGVGLTTSRAATNGMANTGGGGGGANGTGANGGSGVIIIRYVS